MKRKAEQEHSGKHCADAMTGNVDQAVERKKNRGDKGCEPITLVRSFAQRKNFPENQNESDDDQNDCDPTKLGPEPEPIAFGMNRAPVAIGSCAKNSKHVFEITKTDSGPGRVANQLKDIGKDPPPEIGRELGV